MIEYLPSFHRVNLPSIKMYVIFLFILGTAVGSFLNVCIHRLPRGESIIYPISHCPQCKTPLRPGDLIPIVGYLLLFGRCRYCQEKISLRYPLVEILTGFLFVFIFFLPGSYLDYLFRAIFASTLVIIFFTDLEHQVIPDEVSYFGIGWGLLYNFLRVIFLRPSAELNLFFSSLFGMALGFLILKSIAYLGKAYFKKEVMGEGDLFLAAFLGAFLGWQGVILSLFLAYILAAVVSLPLLLFKKLSFGQYIPFGPALATTGMLVLLFGSKIVDWYLKLFL